MAHKIRHVALLTAAATLLTGGILLPAATTAPTAPAKAVDYNIPSLWESYKDYFTMGTFGDWSSKQAKYEYLSSSFSNSLKLDSQIGSSNDDSVSAQAYQAAVTAAASLPADQQAAAIEKANETVTLVDHPSSIDTLNQIEQYNDDNGLTGTPEAKVVRGHNLAWHGSQQPMYFFCNGFQGSRNADGSGTCPMGFASPTTMLARLDDYIHQMMAKYEPYKNIIVAWDVVNEPLDDYTGMVRNFDDSSSQMGQWGNIFRRKDLGCSFANGAKPDLDSQACNDRLQAESVWIRQAFASARKWSNYYGEDWKLYVNDYMDSNKSYYPKETQLIKVLKPIYEAGNIDGYGMQGRLSDALDVNVLKQQIKLGLTVSNEISITEGDIRSDFVTNPYYDPSKPSTPVVATDPQYESDPTASGSVALKSSFNGNTYDVTNSPLVRRRDWPTTTPNFMDLFTGNTQKYVDAWNAITDIANRSDVQKAQADFAADWMDVLIGYKDKVAIYDWDGTNDMNTFNADDGAQLWAGTGGGFFGVPALGNDFEKMSYFAVIGAPARADMRTEIAAAQALDPTRYSKASWAKVTSALKAAQNLTDVRIYTMDGVTAVKNATQALQKAVAGLQSGLPDAIATATSPSLATSFTASSIAPVTAAAKAAQAVADDPAATDAQKNAALDAIDKALGGLVPRSGLDLNDSLTTLVAIGKSIEGQSGAYSSASYGPFAAAMAAALKAIGGDPAELTQARAQSCLDALTSAIAGLKAAPATAPNNTQPLKKVQSTRPAIKGTAKAGRTLRVKTGAWSAGATLTAKWYVGGKKVATAQKLKLKASWKGKKVLVKVTGKKPGELTVTRASKSKRVR